MSSAAPAGEWRRTVRPPPGSVREKASAVAHWRQNICWALRATATPATEQHQAQDQGGRRGLDDAGGHQEHQQQQGGDPGAQPQQALYVPRRGRAPYELRAQLSHGRRAGVELQRAAGRRRGFRARRPACGEPGPRLGPGGPARSRPRASAAGRRPRRLLAWQARARRRSQRAATTASPISSAARGRASPDAGVDPQQPFAHHPQGHADHAGHQQGQHHQVQADARIATGQRQRARPPRPGRYRCPGPRPRTRRTSAPGPGRPPPAAPGPAGPTPVRACPRQAQNSQTASMSRLAALTIRLESLGPSNTAHQDSTPFAQQQRQAPYWRPRSRTAMTPWLRAATAQGSIRPPARANKFLRYRRQSGRSGPPAPARRPGGRPPAPPRRRGHARRSPGAAQALRAYMGKRQGQGAGCQQRLRPAARALHSWPCAPVGGDPANRRAAASSKSPKCQGARAPETAPSVQFLDPAGVRVSTCMWRISSYHPRYCGGLPPLKHMSKTLIIAEKPSGRPGYITRPGGFAREGEYFESERYVLSSSVGHLLEPGGAQRSRQGQMELRPPAGDSAAVRIGSDRQAVQHERLKLLVRLAQRKDVDSIINACDAGRARRADLPLHHPVCGGEQADPAPVAAVR